MTKRLQAVSCVKDKKNLVWNINVSKKRKIPDKVLCVKERRNRWKNLMLVKKKKNFADKVLCVINIYNTWQYVMRQILNSNLERISSQVFAKFAHALSCLRMILDNAFLHLRGCIPYAFILLISSIAFPLKSLYRRELQAILKHSPTRGEQNIHLGMLLTM